MTQQHLQYLLNLYAEGKISGPEEQELTTLLADPANKGMVEQVLDAFLSASHPVRNIDSDAAMAMKAAILKAPRSGFEVKPDSFNAAPSAPIFKLTNVMRYAAAIIIVLAGSYYFIRNKEQKEPIPSTITDQLATSSPAIIPGKHGAILQLANKQTVLLDSMQDGIVNTYEGAAIQLQSGVLSYVNSGTNSGELNTLITPNGRQFQLQLPDGTNVWLNAGSSLTYPTAFIGAKREVRITGEAYFEVQKDKSKPFVVKTSNTEIEVLGTAFNVNNYSEQGKNITTLVEGAVKVMSGKTIVALKPGQQSVLQNNTLKQIVTENEAAVVAWKNGLFDFTDVPFDEAMQQLGRWYDIEIRYEGMIPKKVIWGKMQRDISLEELLHILKKAEVNYRMEGRKLVVLEK